MAKERSLQWRALRLMLAMVAPCQTSTSFPLNARYRRLVQFPPNIYQIGVDQCVKLELQGCKKSKFHQKCSRPDQSTPAIDSGYP